MSLAKESKKKKAKKHKKAQKKPTLEALLYRYSYCVIFFINFTLIDIYFFCLVFRIPYTY